MARADERQSYGWRFWLGVAGWLVVLTSSALAARQVRQFVITDSRFHLAGPDDRIEGLSMQGIVYASRTRILLAFAPDFGRSIYLAPLAERRRRLLGIDWVEDAAISRIWPNRLLVRVTERRPVAFVNLPAPGGAGSQVLLIDAQGVLLDRPLQSTFTFPVLRGVSEEQPESERRRRVGVMLRLLSDLGPLAQDISEVDASLTQNLSIITQADGHTVELFLGDRNFSRRVQNFLNHYPEIRRRSANATAFDLRLDDRITARE